MDYQPSICDGIIGGAGKVYKSSIVKALNDIWRKRRRCLLVGITLRSFGVERYLIHDVLAAMIDDAVIQYLEVVEGLMPQIPAAYAESFAGI